MSHRRAVVQTPPIAVNNNERLKEVLHIGTCVRGLNYSAIEIGYPVVQLPGAAVEDKILLNEGILKKYLKETLPSFLKRLDAILATFLNTSPRNLYCYQYGEIAKFYKMLDPTYVLPEYDPTYKLESPEDIYSEMKNLESDIKVLDSELRGVPYEDNLNLPMKNVARIVETLFDDFSE